jgi:hypothetical protein
MNDSHERDGYTFKSNVSTAYEMFCFPMFIPFSLSLSRLVSLRMANGNVIDIPDFNAFPYVMPQDKDKDTWTPFPYGNPTEEADKARMRRLWRFFVTDEEKSQRTVIPKPTEEENRAYLEDLALQRRLRDEDSKFKANMSALIPRDMDERDIPNGLRRGPLTHFLDLHMKAAEAEEKREAKVYEKERLLLVALDQRRTERAQRGLPY